MILVSALLLPATAGAANEEAGHARKAEIVSGGAAQSDLHLDRFREFDTFLRSHPVISRDFDRQPTLIRSREFRSKHPDWASFLREHPAIEADINANPGNYVVIGPNVASAYGHSHANVRTTNGKV
ncbi:MAG TPA: hypothetical protein VJ728_16270 [Candidatus Binataceae bacterium]|nr:hypothetical protein [Candidatus Binataceae bacterium]